MNDLDVVIATPRVERRACERSGKPNPASFPALARAKSQLGKPGSNAILSFVQRQAKRRGTARVTKNRERQPDAKHRAIQSLTKAGDWIATAGADLPIYVRAMSATMRIEQCAAQVRDLKRRWTALLSAAEELQRLSPDFAFSLGEVTLPSINSRSMADEIVRSGNGSDAATQGIDFHGRIAIFLDQVFEAQCDEQLRLTWIPPSKKRANDGLTSTIGDAPLEPEQLARLVADGVGKIMELHPMERAEVPIVAVAACIEAPATRDGVPLRKEFERRADSWRQKPGLVDERLRRLTLGLVPLSPEAFSAAMRAMFAAPTDAHASEPTAATELPRRRYFDEDGQLVSFGRGLVED